MSLMSQGRFEAAIDDLSSSVLSSPTFQSMEPNSVAFTVDNVLECYLNLCDAKGLEAWLEALKTARQNQPDPALRAAMRVPVDTNYVMAFAKFEAGDYSTAHTHLDLIPGITNAANTEGKPLVVGEPPLSRLQLSTALTLKAMLSEDTSSTASYLDCASKCLEYPVARSSQDGIRPFLPCFIQLHCIGLLQQYMGMSSSSSLTSLQMPILDAPLDSNPLLEQCSQDVGCFMPLLRTKQWLHDKSEQLCSSHELESLRAHIIKVAQKQRNQALASRLLEKADKSTMCGFEAASISYMRGSRTGAIQSMLRIATDASSESNSAVSQETPQIRALLKLSTWLYVDPNTLTVLDKLDTNPADLVEGIDVPDLATNRASEFALALFTKATAVMPGLPKVWLRYGAWCFRQGRTIRDESPAKAASELTELLGAEPSPALLEICTKFLKGTDNSADNTALVAECETALRTVLEGDKVAEVLELLINLEDKIQKQVVESYREAVRSYVQSLKLTAGKETQGDNDTNITVMLRLLRLLVKYGRHFADLFEYELDGCAAMAWCDIVPQLFARLGHPDPFVREQVMLRLQRVGEVATHEVIYSAIVGVQTSAGSLAHAYSAIEGHIKQHSPELVVQVQMMLKALNALTTTSMEQWFSTLQPLIAEIGQRLTKVDMV